MGLGREGRKLRKEEGGERSLEGMGKWNGKGRRDGAVRMEGRKVGVSREGRRWGREGRVVMETF